MSHAVVNPDREVLIQCPYDPVHMISQMRFPYHLIKCRKNHNGKEFSQCPYDAKHVILKTKFKEHLETCNKRAIIEPQLVMDDTRNLELLLPESQADKIQATLSNEWDLEMPSAAVTNNVVTQTVYNTFNSLANRGGAEQYQGVNSFSAGSSTGNTMDQSSGHGRQGNWTGNGGVDGSMTRGGYNGTRLASSRFDSVDSQDDLGYTQPELPRKPESLSKKKEKGSKSPKSGNSSPPLLGLSSGASISSGDSNDTTVSVGRGQLRRPLPTSSKVAAINSTDPHSPPRSYGRGRGTIMKEKEDFCVVNRDAGPASYEIHSLPDTMESDNLPLGASFGRGRGGGNYSEQPSLRRPGMSEKGTKEALEKDRLKLLKKIRETKQLEERLANGEVLEDNQVYNFEKHLFFLLQSHVDQKLFTCLLD